MLEVEEHGHGREICCCENVAGEVQVAEVEAGLVVERRFGSGREGLFTPSKRFEVPMVG